MISLPAQVTVGTVGHGHGSLTKPHMIYTQSQALVKPAEGLLLQQTKQRPLWGSSCSAACPAADMSCELERQAHVRTGQAPDAGVHSSH